MKYAAERRAHSLEAPSKISAHAAESCSDSRWGIPFVFLVSPSGDGVCTVTWRRDHAERAPIKILEVRFGVPFEHSGLQLDYLLSRHSNTQG